MPAQIRMHPANCRVACDEETCVCTPKRSEWIFDSEKSLLDAAKAALQLIRERRLDGGMVGADLENAIMKVESAQAAK